MASPNVLTKECGAPSCTHEGICSHGQPSTVPHATLAPRRAPIMPAKNLTDEPCPECREVICSCAQPPDVSQSDRGIAVCRCEGQICSCGLPSYVPPDTTVATKNGCGCEGEICPHNH